MQFETVMMVFKCICNHVFCALKDETQDGLSKSPARYTLREILDY